jgi:peptide/nickel transport system ATP-binding protein
MSVPDTAAADAPILRVSDLTRHFDVSPSWLARRLARGARRIVRAVDGVSFAIARGETLSLVGESGCGKTTVARLLVGLERPDRGRIEFLGQDLRGIDTAAGRPLRRELQMIFQDPYASLDPRWRVHRIIAEPLRMHRPTLDPPAIAARVDELLGQVGLARADRDKYPHQFSGGQRQRISIARALASRPQLLVCDEPTSALDVSVQAQVLNLMQELQRGYGLTSVFISHNLAVVHHLADRVGVMYLGRLVELAPKRALFAQPRHPYTRMLLDAIPDLALTGRRRTPIAGEVPSPLDPPSGCAFHPRCPHAAARCRAEVPLLRAPDDTPRDATVACHAVEEGRL